MCDVAESTSEIGGFHGEDRGTAAMLQAWRTALQLAAKLRGSVHFLPDSAGNFRLSLRPKVVLSIFKYLIFPSLPEDVNMRR